MAADQCQKPQQQEETVAYETPGLDQLVKVKQRGGGQSLDLVRQGDGGAQCNDRSADCEAEMNRDSPGWQDCDLSEIEEQQEGEQPNAEVMHLLKWLLNKLRK